MTFPSNWVWTTLENTCEIILGQSPPSDTYNTNGVGLPFYQGKTEFGDLYPTTVKWCSKHNKLAKASDILISVRAPVGPTNLCREESCIGRGLAAIRPRHGMPSKYFLYYLRSIENDWDSKATGTTFKAITGNILRRQAVPLAPLHEQERIVERIESLFTQLDAGKVGLKRAQVVLKRYKASVLKSAVDGTLLRKGNKPVSAGWANKKIGDLTDLVAGNAFKKEEYSDTGVRLLQIANVSFGKIIWEQKAFLPNNYLDKYSNLVLKPGDIIMALNRPLLGGELKIGIVQEHDLPAILYQRVGRFDFYDEDVKPYYYYYAQSVRFTDQLKNSLQGVDQPFINKSKLMEFIVSIPPLAEQGRIVTEVERRLSIVQELEQTIKANLKRAGRLRQAILKRAFEGKL